MGVTIQKHTLLDSIFNSVLVHLQAIAMNYTTIKSTDSIERYDHLSPFSRVIYHCCNSHIKQRSY